MYISIYISSQNKSDFIYINNQVPCFYYKNKLTNKYISVIYKSQELILPRCGPTFICGIFLLVSFTCHTQRHIALDSLTIITSHIYP